MPAAVSRALQAITLSPDCSNLFGNAQTRQGKWNPATVLTNMLGLNNGVYGTVDFDDTDPTSAAITKPAGLLTPSVNQGLRGSSANVHLNSMSWNRPSNTDGNAETLLHELGHVYNFTRGSGGFALPNRAELGDDQAFDKLI